MKKVTLDLSASPLAAGCQPGFNTQRAAANWEDRFLALPPTLDRYEPGPLKAHDVEQARRSPRPSRGQENRRTTMRHPPLTKFRAPTKPPPPRRAPRGGSSKFRGST